MQEHLNIAVLEDSGVEAMPEYGPADVLEALEGFAPQPVSLMDLPELDRRQADLLILPYLNGPMSISVLEGLVRFHERGGSLLVLGQLPHLERWAPTRNFHAHRFHLTAYCQEGGIAEVTERGKELLGQLPGLDRFSGQKFGCARTTAYPPDEVVRLFRGPSGGAGDWEASPGIWIERYGRRFLGARMAQIGCTGGEPREAAAGGFPLPWNHDPGLLTRDWPGMNVLLRALVSALRPRNWAAAMEFPPLERADGPGEGLLLVRNLTATPLSVPCFQVRAGDAVVAETDPLELEPDELREIPVRLPLPDPGVYAHRLYADSSILHTCNRRVELPRKQDIRPGFGCSTYWSFQQPSVDPEFQTFCRIMKARGCRYVRANIPWEDVEPAPGRYDWRIPDGMIATARELDLHLQFWMFPITRGATIGDGGVPQWTLKEPARTHDGRPGLFPSLWSPFYRKHYFGMLEAFAERYADEPRLERFVFDFGNSDFPYGYFYYVNDLTLFDYSPHERKAFCRYLLEQRNFALPDIGSLYRMEFRSPEDVPVPLAEKHPDAWRVYLDFRAWSIRQGMETVQDILRRHAPDKLPPDLPGHGAGSIADLSTYHLESKARHWEEEQQTDPGESGLHNAGPSWGGEAWQVGAGFREYDDALFQSVRLGSDYFTIPGPDIGVYGDDIARCGFIRRALEGAQRERPRIGILDRCEWDAFQSLAHVGARMDQPVDLLSPRHRYDMGVYDLLVLPPDEKQGRTATGGGGGQLLPPDRAWAERLRTSVEGGLQLLMFPDTAQIQPDQPPHTFVRQVLGLDDVQYEERMPGKVPGIGTGAVRGVRTRGEVVWATEDGRPVLVRCPVGRGAVWLAGWDTEPDSLDGRLSPASTETVAGHTLVRVASELGLESPRIHSGQQYVYKEWVRNECGEFLLLFSHRDTPVRFQARVKLDSPVNRMMDLSTGEIFHVIMQDSVAVLDLELHPCCGRYLRFQA